jgi:hypothetical protein
MARIKMKDLFKNLEKIDCNKGIDEQLEVLKPFKNISDQEIKELANTFKNTEAGIVLKYLGYEKVKNFLPEILEMLDVYNWSQSPISELLRPIGKPLIPYVKEALINSKNELLDKGILVHLIEHWPQEYIFEIKEQIINIFKRGEIDGASSKALDIILEKEILTNEEIINIIERNNQLIKVIIEILGFNNKPTTIDQIFKILLSITPFSVPIIKEELNIKDKENYGSWSDPDRHLHLLNNVIKKWPKHLLLEINDELVILSKLDDLHGVGNAAISLLEKLN